MHFTSIGARLRGWPDRRTYRLATHALIALAVVTVPAGGAILSPGHLTGGPFMSVQALASSPAGSNISRGYLQKPALVLRAPAARPPQPSWYSVQKGDALETIASRFRLRLDTIRQSNHQIVSPDRLRIGDVLLIPPTNGVMVLTKEGDSVASIAARYHADASTIAAYNLIRDPDHLAAGVYVMIPDGTGLLAPSELGSGAEGSVQQLHLGHSRYNNFPYGQCTWYVASMREIPWTGDAWSWFQSATARGFATGQSPRVGSIMVTWEDRQYGHVALVDAVYGDNSWRVTEMNYHGLGQVDQRRIWRGNVPLIGFIY